MLGLLDKGKASTPLAQILRTMAKATMRTLIIFIHHG